MKFNLCPEKLCGITTDEAPAMIGKHKGLTSLMRKYISHEVITHHCIIHQQLCVQNPGDETCDGKSSFYSQFH